MTNQFEYVVWFRDGSLPPTDQDHEWPAVFVVEAATKERAKTWGDRLARPYSARTEQPILCSKAFAVEYAEGDFSRTPLVQEGVEPSDEEIGW